MVLGAFFEAFVVIGLLGGGTIINRDTASKFAADNSSRWNSPRAASPAPRARKYYDAEEAARPDEETVALGSWARDADQPTAAAGYDSGSEAISDPTKRQRTLRLWKWRRTVETPNTEVFKDRILSRLLRKFPFLVEAWYWALIYWVYQLGRAFTAIYIIDESVVDVARRHALQVLHVEQSLHLFVELPIQQYFLEKPFLMHWINRIYSFIHIPGTILFLIVLYYVTTTRPAQQLNKAQTSGVSPTRWRSVMSNFHPQLYERRRRTMAMCNLMAFIIFTAWPCMPPRLLSDAHLVGGSSDAQEALGYGFVDTVHSATGESSVWTTNKFCNQYAAMPSLHFGYSLLIGLTIATIPLGTQNRYCLKRSLVALGAMIYPAIILTAIVATANHFVLDAVAGALVCAVAWHTNGFLLNLLPLEDYFLWAVRIHKPSKISLHNNSKVSFRI
ncbi:integral membrane protein [Niveomyces insectorum RCEF 264]|uniref:Integral membrane protein n=1 Tax=Niveomyces insectorum RCEF 264 TaxID=1081102 RepID=A0A167W5J6_9HYPO|nr:integral membrane protein [Niveomyces insectorum RCEF 264]